MLRVEVVVVDDPVQVLRDVHFRFDERAVDDELRRGVGELDSRQRSTFFTIGSKLRCIWSTPM